MRHLDRGCLGIPRRRPLRRSGQLPGADRVRSDEGRPRSGLADNAIKLAVDMTVAGIQRLNLQGNAEQQSQDLLQAMRLVFPEAVILVREAREGFGT